MAAAKLEGRAYLYSFVDAVLNKLSSLDVNSTPEAKKLADQKLLQKLRKSLRATRPVLDDAEQKQIRDQEVNKWLIDLQDALYMADDLLDELSTKAATATPTPTPTQRDPGNSSSWSHYVDSILEDSDDDELGVVTSMQDIVAKLESIVEEKDDLDLKQGVAKDLEDMSWRIQSSLLESSDIYGRNDDKEAIIKLLLDETCDDILSVISIEGIGGIGKTTLAQLVYNDARVKKKFAIKAWVCVATKFDPVNVTKAIIEDIASSPCNMVNLNSIQTELKEKLTEKTFLVVLDDVWDNHQNLWDNFLKPFLRGNKGSKILLTTRNRNVDSVVSTTNRHYKLDILSDEYCWSLFLKHSSISTSSRQYVILEQIGKKIVEKCKGLPLAVKTLGGLLRNKDNVEDWENILESKIWELPEEESKIVLALRVSYHYLPSHLKRCFVYCSLYPEDYQFGKEELIFLWMAEDFVQPIESYTLYNIGRVYFDELVARSFFQPSSKYVSLFVMHDLATFFAGKFYFRIRKFGDPHKICSKTRHLSYMINPYDPIFRLGEAYKGAIHMRTFLDVHFPHQPRGLIKLESEFWLLQLQMRCLRVLSLKCFSIESLPDSIGELIHLRYLDLSKTPIVTLPESLCKLYNLQTLKLKYCEKLEMLPSRMQDLVNLRHLDIREADSLKEMPKGMSKLKHLNFLSGYIVGKHEENGITELGALDNLHGSLCISKLENIENSREALEAKMGNKKHINILELIWRREADIVDVESARDILEELQPHRNLKVLTIIGYRGEIFPDWLGFGLSCYSNMTKLMLSSCKNCRQVPSVGQLPSLQHLEICGLDGLERIGGEFYNNAESSHQETPFRSLRRLRFHGMLRWREWHIPRDFDGFQKLKSLSIRGCPVLSGDLPTHLPALEELTIHGCEELACSLPRAPKLHQLIVKGSGFYGRAAPHEVLIEETQLAKSTLECLPHIQSPCLQRLIIDECRSAISISGDYFPDSLQFLRIRDCSKLTFSEPLQHKSLTIIRVEKCDSLTLFPLGALPNLKKLSISKCPCLASVLGLGFAAPHLEELYMRDCPEMDCFGEECLPPSLTTLEIRRCQKLERWITWRGLQSEGLTCLILEGWKEVKSFPREGCLPASLKYLHLSWFSNLETLDCKGLHQLTSLQQLTIECCPKLENITQQNLPASLSKLLVKGECPLKSKLEEVNDPRIQFEKA
ncbi:putative disease resistance RPP13-like protein 1 [Arachis hypogaea]|uniref:putative disease resistance RPP13-like protein 1 n=1 Tax=Arachis hypogaea TaxID=3818 RepID=UPI000DECFA6E|nr:putative disease resistance protein At3g14460 [Arachis hypogaea]